LTSYCIGELYNFAKQKNTSIHQHVNSSTHQLVNLPTHQLVNMQFETKAIRLQMPGTQQREHSTPLYNTSSYRFDNAEHMRAAFAGEIEANIYSRYTNPNVREFEQKIAALEGCEDAFGTASGMAAVFTSFASILESGDHVLASSSLFGSSFQVVTDTLPKWNIQTTLVSPTQPETWAQHLRPNTKMFFLETPTNPGLEIIDLETAGKFAAEHQLILNVDNCFATPYLQNPAKFGAHLISHSATKYIDGQGRVVGGVVTGEQKYVDAVRQFVRRTGASMAPFNAWILSKSLETLGVRMDRHCANALKVATFLESHSSVNSVRYPFLDSHPQADIAREQMRQGGGIVTFEIKGGLDAGRRFLDSLKMFSLSANLGDARSIATHPASTTHSKLPPEVRAKMSITDGLIRISTGLEHSDDIIADIEQAI